MDYVLGFTLEDKWGALNKRTRNKVTSQVAGMIEKMQSITPNDMRPGPIGGGAPFRGPWFSDYGAGPFDTPRTGGLVKPQVRRIPPFKAGSKGYTEV